MNVSELRKICEYIEKEFGPDIEIRLQVRDLDGRLIDQDYCSDAFIRAYKLLVLGNYELESKEASRPWKTGVDMNQNSAI